jgi:hypothetical protein
MRQHRRTPVVRSVTWGVRVPRTVAVIARTDLHLEALAADDFVAVVTGYRASADTSEAHVDGLLGRFTPTVPSQRGG